MATPTPEALTQAIEGAVEAVGMGTYTGSVLLAAIAAIVALGFVVYLAMDVLKQNKGTELMADISHQVQLGAKAFLIREYIWVFSGVIVIGAIFTLLGSVKPDLGINFKTAIAFGIGAVASAMAGVIGMWIATSANCRTANGALEGGKEDGLRRALSIAVSGGAVMGFGVVGISLVGLVICLLAFKNEAGLPDTTIINGYAMGASLVALFGRSGGGIFTKGADMGADLVGKVEAGLPEDDPRNPAVIADNVGDNVGDVAGLGADLLESYVESIIAALAIAGTVGLASMSALPLVIAAVGIFASIVGIFVVKAIGKKDAQKSLMMGTYVAAGLAILGTAVAVAVLGEKYTEGAVEFGKWGPFWATVFGVVSGSIIGFVSEYYTSDHYAPVKLMAKNSQSGPAIAVTEGLAIGMRSTGIATIVLALAVFYSYDFAGIYGVALAALGMLATTGMIVSVDAYGPIADNAGGIAEMADLDPGVRQITDNLDSVGNTTAAIGKGFAIGSAAFAALALLAAYMKVAEVDVANIADPKVLAGLLIGAMLPFVFSSFLFRAVSNCAFKMIEEVRRQFREIPGLKEGKEGVKPDSATCVAISTQGAIQGMLLPGAMAMAAPVIMGLIDKGALAGMLTGALACGIMLGLQTANSGGAMDNAKKHIEAGNYGGKNSEAHKAAVIGDTVGDPLKDTVGPSINILIKLMCVISLVLAPLFR